MVPDAVATHTRPSASIARSCGALRWPIFASEPPDESSSVLSDANTVSVPEESMRTTVLAAGKATRTSPAPSVEPVGKLDGAAATPRGVDPNSVRAFAFVNASAGAIVTGAV